MIVFSNNINKTTQFVVKELLYSQGLSSTYEKIICDDIVTAKRLFRDVSVLKSKLLELCTQSSICKFKMSAVWPTTTEQFVTANSQIHLVVIVKMFLLIKQF